MKRNKFKILIASYNNEHWVEYNLASVLNQTYDNYEVIYVDDCSQDNTFEKVKKIVGDNKKFTIIKNKLNLGGTYNHTRFFDSIEDDEILVLIDGDDWFFDDHVLDKLNSFYNEKDVWMTYGKFYSWDGENATEAYPQNSEFSNFVHDNKLYRLDTWRSSHLRTYKGFLVKSIDKKDFISNIDNKLFWHAADLALAFPCLEICPKEKIGVLDFPSYVYNASKIASNRTREREAADNTKYEIEIRNKKKYKENSFGEKLPQINVIGYYHETNYIPKDFSYVYDIENGEQDINVITDFSILEYIKGKKKINRGKIIADLHESPFHNEHMKETYDSVYKNYHMFDLILTYDSKLLTLPNAEKRLCMWRCLNKNIHTKQWPILEDSSLYKIYSKTKNISCISSNKAFLPGHVFRLEMVKYILSKDTRNYIDMYGIGFNEIIGKIDGLKDYRFSIAIENAYIENWATEKLSDCFLTGTIPIYYGCPNIGDMFDINGIITFNTKEELEAIIIDLYNNGDKIYESKLESIKRNFELVNNYSLNTDQLFHKHLKKLL